MPTIRYTTIGHPMDETRRAIADILQEVESGRNFLVLECDPPKPTPPPKVQQKKPSKPKTEAKPRDLAAHGAPPPAENGATASQMQQDTNPTKVVQSSEERTPILDGCRTAQAIACKPTPTAADWGALGIRLPTPKKIKAGKPCQPLRLKLAIWTPNNEQ